MDLANCNLNPCSVYTAVGLNGSDNRSSLTVFPESKRLGVSGVRKPVVVPGPVKVAKKSVVQAG
jgi:hypothetical protein